MKTPAIASILVGTLLTLAIGAFVLSRAPAIPNESDTKNTPETAHSGKQTYGITIDGLDREFIVYLPASASDTEPLPVVFMLHGSGGTGEEFFQKSGWKEQADAEGFIAVFPTGYKHHIYFDEVYDRGVVREDVSRYQTKWISFGLEDMLDPAYPNQPVADDVAFFREMVDFLKTNYSVDAERMYVTGFSNGAAMTTRLALEMSDTFAAFAPSGAGLVSPDMKEYGLEVMGGEYTPRPILMIIGENDGKIGHAFGLNSFTMDESAGASGDPLYHSFIKPMLAFTQMEDLYEYERTERVSHFAYTTPLTDEPERSFHLLVLEGMGHQYANGVNYPINASNIIWTFFEEYSL